jgi:putative aldouronate transport system permease protein
MSLASLTCILPFILLIIGSLTDDGIIVQQGYSFVPEKWSTAAYGYLSVMANTIVRAYGVTLFSTAAGTAVSLILTSLMGYGLSFPNLPGKKILSFFVVFTMLFNGGLVPTYVIYTQIFHIKNTLWAQIVPGMLVSGFHVMLMRSFFQNNIPPSLVESARIDGAKDLRIFFAIVLPMSLPILATIGLLTGVTYWNNWTNGLYYLTQPDFYNVQNILNKMLMDIRYLQSGAAGDYAGDILSSLPANSVRMAIAVIGALPILFVYPFFQRYFVKGITVGAVKE